MIIISIIHYTFYLINVYYFYNKHNLALKNNKDEKSINVTNKLISISNKSVDPLNDQWLNLSGANTNSCYDKENDLSDPWHEQESNIIHLKS